MRVSQTVEQLKQTVEDLEEAKLCPVCIEHRKDTVFQCGHQACNTCAGLLTECPMCRAPIELRIKVYDG